MASAEKLSVLELSEASAIQRVRTDGTEPRDVEVIGAASDLFVRRERYPHRSVCHGRMTNQVFGGRHDCRHSRLVVGAEQGGARRSHDVVADLRGECRLVAHAQDGRRVIRQHDVTAVVLTMHDRPDTGPRHLRRSIHMRHEANHGDRAGRCRWNGCHDVPMLVHRRVVDTYGLQLVDELAQEGQLAGRAGKGAGAFVRAGIHNHIAKESFESGGVHARESNPPMSGRFLTPLERGGV